VNIGVIKIAVPVWHTVDWFACALSFGAALAMLRFHVGMIPTLAACAALGVGRWYFFG
jgi:chromate transporter